MREEDAIKRTAMPVTPPRIVRELRALGVEIGDTLLIHTSLSKLGWVPGGAHGAIEALIECVGTTGTLVMPTFTAGLSDPTNWRNPPVPLEWHNEIRATMPAYDPRKSPTRKMGAINETFRSWPGVLRGPHPHISFAALGPLASHVVSPHSVEGSLEESPLARLYANGAKVLFLGTGFATCTSFHLAEGRAGTRGRLVRTGAPMMMDGERRWVAFDDWNADEDDFAALGAAFERDTKVVSIGKIGEATCRLFPMRAAVDFATAWLKTNRKN